MNIKQMLIILRFFSILAHSDLLRRKAPKSSRPSATRRRIRGSNGARWKDARSWRSCVWRQRQTNSDFERLAPRWIFCWRKEGRIWTAVTKFLLKMTRYILTGIPLVLIDLLFCFLPSLFKCVYLRFRGTAEYGDSIPENPLWPVIWDASYCPRGFVYPLFSNTSRKRQDLF